MHMKISKEVKEKKAVEERTGSYSDMKVVVIGVGWSERRIVKMLTCRSWGYGRTGKVNLRLCQGFWHDPKHIRLPSPRDNEGRKLSLEERLLCSSSNHNQHIAPAESPRQVIPAL
ncbi:hypothetical protein AXG93_1504s1300 [Marchantia polymorpha subsp. ruderalis]|uniref:Uncharacterized protein n=1 Tax=Marchantia polymorpha subsp. ruderalis TaxID=1480154 RepID=A0A176VN63_MARPO|nr:hypothetical protein AXG93_1504s1300 [Marchantia polymorpha subsp. ruderalis]